MSKECDVLRPDRPPNNQSSVVVVCQGRILMLAEITDVTV